MSHHSADIGIAVSRAWEGFLTARARLVRAWASVGHSPDTIATLLHTDTEQIASFIAREPDGGDEQRRIEWLEREHAIAIEKRDARRAALTHEEYAAALRSRQCPVDQYDLRPAAHQTPRVWVCRCGLSISEPAE